MLDRDPEPMPAPVTSGRSARDTRQRILRAARLRFAAQSYEATALRHIAGDVGVDVALVHRAFGSKEALFREAVASAFDDGFAQAAAAPAPAGPLAARLSRQLGQARADEPAPFDIIVRSLCSGQARPMLREMVLRDFVAPLAARFDEDGQTRATLALACLAGVALLGESLGPPALDPARMEEVVPMLEAMLDACLGAPTDATPA